MAYQFVFKRYELKYLMTRDQKQRLLEVMAPYMALDKVTIPEDLDYTGIFDDLMQAYTTAHELVRVKTTNMGSMFRLTYRITLREAKLEKSLIDSIRCRNGNLEITVSNQETAGSEL